MIATKYLFNILTAGCLVAALPANAQTHFDGQAHRGGRGRMPENTIPAMKYALDMGATLEMDLHFSKDKKLVVAHDDRISPVFALNPDGSPVTKEQTKNNQLNKLLYSAIVKFDIGSRLNPKFPQQKKMVAHIPLFSVLIDSVEAYAKTHHLPSPHYDIEAKIPADTLAPGFRKEFIKQMMDIILKKGIQKRVMIQSFDIGMLQQMHAHYPAVQTSYLIAVNKADLENDLKKLGFKPTLYGPNYKDITRQMVEACHKMGMKILPGVVNTKTELNALKALGIDGVITDFPDILK